MMNTLSNRLFRRMILLPASAVFLLAATSTAQAHQLYAGGYCSRTIGVSTANVNSSWASYIGTSMSSWNNAGVSANIVAGGAYANSMSTADLSPSVLGVFEPLTCNSNPSHRTTKFRIRLNTDYNGEDGLTKRWTIVHELGHALGVGHEEVAAANMRSYESQYYYPTSDDKNAVIAAWK